MFCSKRAFLEIDSLFAPWVVTVNARENTSLLACDRCCFRAKIFSCVFYEPRSLLN